MIAGIADRLDLGLRRLLPLATALAAVLFDLLPLPAPGPDGLATFALLGVIYFWSLYRPDLTTSGMVFALGVVHDALSGLPMGLSALALLLTRHAMVRQQRFFFAKSFIVVWFCFALLAPVLGLLRYGVACLWWGNLFAPSPVLFEVALTVVLYPCISWLLVRVHAAIPRLTHEP